MISQNNICKKNGGCVLKIDKKIGYNACFFLLGCFGAGRCKDTALTKQKSVYELMKNITKRPEYKKKFKAIINLGDSFYDVDKFTEDIWNKTIVNLNQEKNDLDKALKIMQKYNCISDTLERARHFAKVAIDSLGLFKDNIYKITLMIILILNHKYSLNY